MTGTWRFEFESTGRAVVIVQATDVDTATDWARLLVETSSSSVEYMDEDGWTQVGTPEEVETP